MSDDRPGLARYLPLSTKGYVNESGVTDDWRARLDELEAANDLTPDVRAVFGAARQRRRVRVTDLGRALVAVYEAVPDAAVASVTSGAVALAKAVSAPLPIRAVIRDRTLRASDAEWEFGHGKVLEGTARELVLFLYGVGPLPGS